MDKVKEIRFHAQIRQDKVTLFSLPEVKDGPIVERVGIEGWASTAGMDRDNEVVEPSAISAGVDAFMRNPVVLYMHNAAMPVGKVTDMEVDPVAGFFVKAMLSAAKDVADIATKVREGILRAFSIGFRALDGKSIGDVWHITKLELYEISIVSIPSNRESLFSMAKGFRWGTDLVVPPLEIDRVVEEKIKALNLQPGAVVKDVVPEYENLQRILREGKDAASRTAVDRIDGILKNLKDGS